MGPYNPGDEPTKRQETLVKGAQILDAAMAHAVSAYAGSARLLTFQGGAPLPWSAMVLARTAFEASLRVLWVLEPGVSDDVLLSRIAATAFEELEERRKQHEVLPDAFEPKDRVLREIAAVRQFLQGPWRSVACP